MPHRRPKPSLLLGAATVLVVASPFAALTMDSSDTDVHAANDSNLVAIPTQIASVVLSSMPDLVLPLKQLTGLNLPDLHLSDLKKLPLPKYVPVPEGLPLPPGVQLPSVIEIPSLDSLGTAAAPAPAGKPAAGQPVIPGLDQLPPGTAEQLGATVKEITRNTPFSMIALTAQNLAGAQAQVRAKQPNGSWSPWMSTDQIETGRSDKGADGAVAGTEPIYIGKTNTVQVLTTHKPTGAATASNGVHPISFSTPLRRDDPAAPAPNQAAPAAAPNQAAPAAVPDQTAPAAGPDQAAPAAENLSAVLIEPGSAPTDAKLSDVADALPGGGPKVITRAGWGADESIRCDKPIYNDGLGGATVHHTAGRNEYTKEESAGIVRAIYAYHAKTLHWCDIGYNALVDKYGQIFEGRFGGLDKPVEGAHAGGFNENTSGVALIGDYSTTAPTSESVDAIGRFLGWRLKVAKLDPKGHTTMFSEGTKFTAHPKGEAVNLPVIFAHRDVGQTDCPGDAAYAQLDRIRDIAARAAAGDAPKPAPNGPALKPNPAAALVDALPVLADQLLKITDPDPIAKKWAAEGGPTGRLGEAKTGLTPVAGGAKFAQFANGYIFDLTNGDIVSIVGKVLEKFVALGGQLGELGLPLANEYLVPEGMRQDFQNGSLIFNQVTGFVTKILGTFTGTYDKEYNSPGSTAGDAAAPMPAPPAETPPAGPAETPPAGPA